MGKRTKEHNKKIAKRNEKIKTAKRVYDKTREKYMMQLIRQIEDENAKKLATEQGKELLTEVEDIEILEAMSDNTDTNVSTQALVD